MFTLRQLFACILIFIASVNITLCDNDIDNRLPKNIQPDLYELTLVVNHERSIYTGNVTINISVINTTSSIHLHFKDGSVNWRGAVLKQNGNRQIDVIDINPQKNDIFGLKFSENLAVGLYTLQLSFFGVINRDVVGLYAVTKEIRGGSKRTTIGTNFYPTFARNVFPCFDEPEYKAKFQLSLYHDKNFTVLSNMPATKRTGPLDDYNNFVLSEFPVSIKMSTHSFGFIIGQYATYTVDSQRVHVYAPTTENVTNSLWFYQHTCKVLDLLELYLGNAFKLPKLDLVAIDSVAESGINTWGIIRVPESYLYYDHNNPRDTIVNIHQTAVSFIANQIARSWFTNEITPKWWNSLWLNDGFAKYLEYFITAEIKPEWRLAEQFLVRENHVALSMDAGLTAIALTIPSKLDANQSPSNLMESHKAGAIIRMLDGTFGTEVLKKIIQQYIAKQSYSTTTPDDLFDIIQTVINAASLKLPTTAKQILESWTDLPGFPMIKLTRHYGDASKVTIVQKRFVSDVDKTGNEKWPERFIPISVSSKEALEFNDTQPSFWLTPNATTVSHTMQPPVSPSSWIIVNNQQTGFYRVNYDRSNWYLLINALARENFDNIPVLNRAQLVDDSFNLAKSGERSFEIAFGILNYLRGERDFIPWNTAARSLAFLDRMMGGQAHHKLLELFIRNITRNVYNLVPVTRNETNHAVRLQRLDVSKLACKAGLSTCVEEINGAFQQILRDSNLIMPEVQEVVFCTAAKFTRNPNGMANSIMQYVLNMFTKQNGDKEELYRVVAGLGCLQDQTLLLRYLDLTTMVLPPSYNIDLTKSDRQIIYKSILAGSYVGAKAALTFLRNSFSTIEMRFESMEKLLGEIGPFIVSDEIKKLFNDVLTRNKSKLTEQMRLAAAHSLAVGEQNLKWINAHTAEISKWLTDNVLVEDAPSGASSINVLNFAFLLFVSILFYLNASSFNIR